MEFYVSVKNTINLNTRASNCGKFEDYFNPECCTISGQHSKESISDKKYDRINSLVIFI